MAKKEKTNTKFTCTICSAEYDIAEEGGIEGNFGILPVAFCPTCTSCMYDMVRQMNKGEWD